MGNIAIITARGGSKRIPHKNIKEFCGKPIITYSIKAALESNIFDEVMVSTDDEQIADVARRFGAAVPFMRSEKNSNDFATTNDVLKEVLNEYAKLGKKFDIMCCIYPTAPFVTSKKLLDAFELIRRGASSVMPVVKFSFPPQRGMVINDEKLNYVSVECAKMRSQDLEPIYHDCGQFYFYKFDEENNFIDADYTPIVMDECEVQDIDNEADWKIAEMKYKLMIEGEK